MKAAAKINGDEITVEITFSIRQIDLINPETLADIARRIVLVYLSGYPRSK